MRDLNDNSERKGRASASRRGRKEDRRGDGGTKCVQKVYVIIPSEPLEIQRKGKKASPRPAVFSRKAGGKGIGAGKARKKDVDRWGQKEKILTW